MTGLIPDTPEQLAYRRGQAVSVPKLTTAGEIRMAFPPDWIQTEDQLQMGSCAGNAMSTLLEKLAFILGMSKRQLSRLFMYVEGQRKSSGLGNPDAGAPLFGVIEAAKDVGCCGEELVPYGPYRTKFPAEAYADAKKLRARTTLNLESYDDWRAVLGQNMGGVLMGLNWPVRLQDGFYAPHYQPTAAYGHAITALFLADTEDSRGRPDVWVANSHGKSFGRNGWMKVSASFIDELQANDVFGNQGVTDLDATDLKPRVISWVENNPW